MAGSWSVDNDQLSCGVGFELSYLSQSKQIADSGSGRRDDIDGASREKSTADAVETMGHQVLEQGIVGGESSTGESADGTVGAGFDNPWQVATVIGQFVDTEGVAEAAVAFEFDEQCVDPGAGSRKADGCP